MAATLTAYNDALREVWTDDRLQEQMFNDTGLLDTIEKTSRFNIGGVASVPLHVSRNGGYTVFPAGGGTLNTAGNQGVDKAQFYYTHHHQPIAIQGDVLAQTSSNAKSVANVLETEVSGALTDLRRQIQRQLFQNGDALITACGTTTTTNVVVLDPTDGLNAIERGWLFVGQPVDIGTAASQASLINGESITAVGAATSAATTTITVTTSISTTSANYVSHKGARSGTTAYEMNGLRNLVSTTADYGTLTVAGQPVWKAASVDTTSQALTLSLMLQQNQKVHQKTGKPANMVVTGLKQQRKFYELLQTQVRFAGDGAQAAGSVDAPTWNGMKIVVDPDCPNEDMFFLQKDHIFLVAEAKPQWQNAHTGGEVLSWIQTQDAYGGKLEYRLQLATDRRNGHARLGGLS